MARESGLWAWLKRARLSLKDELHMHRVENGVMRGMPDVEGFLLGANQFWIELKSSERPKRANTPVRFKVRDREAQSRWLCTRWKLGGRAWLLLQVGSGASRSLYLVRGLDADEVYGGVTEARLAELSALDGTRPSQEDVVLAASLRARG